MSLNPSLETLEQAGFRLQRLEVYNWGTFREVWTLDTKCQTSLLTGANGSGKSTLVDALLTLLVPNTKRNYNQASNEQKRRERTEKTYVRGAYGKRWDEETNSRETKYLRPKNPYSALLAVFTNSFTGQAVSLAQALWLPADDIEKFYLIARRELNIVEHFKFNGNATELRKQLRSLGAEIHTKFGDYSQQVCKIFNLRSDKGLDLFNQIASIKEIGGLNDFVRAHMLERHDATDRINQLRQNYENLTAAHNAIQKAERQLEQLEPIAREIKGYQQTLLNIEEAETCVRFVPVYFAERKVGLLTQAIGEQQERLGQRQNGATQLKQELETYRKQQLDVNIAISNDTAGRRIQQLESESDLVQEKYQSKKRQADQYNSLSLKLKGPAECNNQKEFYRNREAVLKKQSLLETKLKELVEERDQKKQQSATLKKTCEELDQEIKSLKQRQSQIPLDDLRIRATLTKALGLNEASLPFVGELLKIRDEAATIWEAAIERLLRGYARQILVPDEYYHDVSSYVNKTNLRGRLVYQRIVGSRSHPNISSLSPKALYHKLEIKPDTNFKDWLRANLVEQYNYICCEDLEQFQREPRAITASGQVKHGASRHEKDDRYVLGDRKQYVLGWSNQDKIKALQAELSTKSEELTSFLTRIGQIEKEQLRLNELKLWARDFVNFEDFNVIDWQSEERKLEQLRAQKKELETSANQLKKLQEQLEAVNLSIKSSETAYQATLSEITTLTNKIADYQKEQTQCRARLNAETTQHLPKYKGKIENDLKNQPVTLETVDNLTTTQERFYNSSASSHRGILNGQNTSIVRQMTRFKDEFPVDTEDLDASAEAAPGYVQLLGRINQEDLPRHKKDFKKMLDEKIITDITMFKKGLEDQIDEIKISINSLNLALRKIDYTPTSYIRLRSETNRDAEISGFRAELRACLPDVGANSAEANEASFQRIKKLIERFGTEERWRQKVTDVRNWLDFSAEELYQEDGKQKNFYSDSEGKSGGQKAKLAYTILASAIAYQYGLDQEENQGRSFRFVVVDEAFSKSDETNARYAMELFKQLNLQLLVVTPLDKIQLVEPYIATCHLVTNNQDENNSQIFPIERSGDRLQKLLLALTDGIR